MISIRKILVPVDFSEISGKAMRYGIEIGRDRKSQLYFLHVINQRTLDAIQSLSAKGYKGDFVKVVKKLTQDTRENLTQLLPEGVYEELRPEILIRKGHPSQEIISAAKELAIDLIVLGSHGRSGLAARFLGGVAHNVVNDAPCPVLLVRPVAHDFIE